MLRDGRCYMVYVEGLANKATPEQRSKGSALHRLLKTISDTVIISAKSLRECYKSNVPGNKGASYGRGKYRGSRR